MAKGDASEKARLVDAADSQGYTALHYACLTGRYESVSLLLDAGANPSKITKRGMTMLDICAMFEAEDTRALGSHWPAPILCAFWAGTIGPDPSLPPW
jgi:ankyrin repeat protein